MKVIQAVDQKLELLHKSPRLFAVAMLDIAEAIARGNRDDELARTNDLAGLLSDTMMLADVVGRRRALIERDALSHNDQPPKFSNRWRYEDPTHYIAKFDRTPIFPRTEFSEAIKDILSREPRIARNSEQIREAYASGGFAVKNLPDELADRARLNLTVRLQKQLAAHAREGTPIPMAAERVAEVGQFSRAYGENVYRTNLATAFTAGRFKQALDPDVAEIVAALEYTAVGDADTRPNHMAADGLIAPQTHGVWALLSPPLGHQCRCDVRFVDFDELKSRGLLSAGGLAVAHYPPNFRNAHADENFKLAGRTDRLVYGG